MTTTTQAHKSSPKRVKENVSSHPDLDSTSEGHAHRCADIHKQSQANASTHTQTPANS